MSNYLRARARAKVHRARLEVENCVICNETLNAISVSSINTLDDSECTERTIMALIPLEYHHHYSINTRQTLSLIHI